MWIGNQKPLQNPLSPGAQSLRQKGSTECLSGHIPSYNLEERRQMLPQDCSLAPTHIKKTGTRIPEGCWILLAMDNEVC